MLIEKSIQSSRSTQLFKWGLIVVALIYLVNSFTPLRLHVDSLRYFAIKDCIELGCDPNSEAAKDYLPYGYTALLLLLSKLNLLNSFCLVLINCAFLLGSLFLLNKIAALQKNKYIVFLLVLLNWTTIKFVAHPLSEMQYLFFSMASLYFFYKYTQQNRFKYVFLSFVMAGFAFLTRTVAVALVAALVLGLLWQHKNRIIEFIKTYKWVAIGLVAVVAGVLVFSKQLGLNHYTGVFSKQFEEGVGVRQMFGWHFTEWSELFVNMPKGKLLSYFPRNIMDFSLLLLGVLLFVAFLFLLFKNKKFPFVVKAYLLLYFVLMFNWPFYDPRFWVPVLPLMIALIFTTNRNGSKILKPVSSAILVLYVLSGLISTAFFTYTSLNKSLFARTQASAVYRNEYETVFFGKPQSDTAQLINKEALHVLERYEK